MTLKKYLLVVLTLGSCNSYYNKIPKEDKQLIPYKGNETLIFKSNKSHVDTIFLQGYEEFSSPIDQWSFPLKYIDHRILLSKRTDPNYNRYLDSLVFISLINDGTTQITINLTAKYSWFFGGNTFTKSKFLHLKDTTMKIGKNFYQDVLIIRTNVDDKKTKLNKKYFGITTIYWSKTNGLIRFDDDNSESWEIVKE